MVPGTGSGKRIERDSSICFLQNAWRDFRKQLVAEQRQHPVADLADSLSRPFSQSRSLRILTLLPDLRERFTRLLLPPAEKVPCGFRQCSAGRFQYERCLRGFVDYRRLQAANSCTVLFPQFLGASPFGFGLAFGRVIPPLALASLAVSRWHFEPHGFARPPTLRIGKSLRFGMSALQNLVP